MKTSNNKRRLALSRKWKLLTAFVVIFAAVGAFLLFRSYAATDLTASAGCSKGYCYYPMEPKIAWWVNDIRKQNGKGFLPLNDCASSFARSWAAEMARRGQLIHYGVANGNGPWLDAMNRCGNKKLIGENLWTGFCKNISDADCAWKVAANTSPDPNQRSWFTSPSHFANMTNGVFTSQGVGIFKQSDGRVWAVAEFIQQ